MNFKKSDIKKYFIVLGFFWTLLAIFYLFQKNKFKKILDNPNYTIGLIQNIEYGRSEDYYIYKYSIDNKDYEKGIGASSSNNLFIGKRYFVIFEKGSPRNSMLLPFMHVPDSITNAPTEGWKELPIPVDKERIKWFLEKY